MIFWFCLSLDCCRVLYSEIHNLLFYGYCQQQRAPWAAPWFLLRYKSPLKCLKSRLGKASYEPQGASISPPGVLTCSSRAIKDSVGVQLLSILLGLRYGVFSASLSSALPSTAGAVATAAPSHMLHWDDLYAASDMYHSRVSPALLNPIGYLKHIMVISVAHWQISFCRQLLLSLLCISVVVGYILI